MNKYKLLLVAIVATGLLLPGAARAVGLDIQVGDRPFYNHGPQYWHNNYQMVWVPGHMSQGHHWVHGQYVRYHGNHQRHYSNFHRDYQQDNYRDNYRDDNRR